MTWRCWLSSETALCSITHRSMPRCHTDVHVKNLQSLRSNCLLTDTLRCCSNHRSVAHRGISWCHCCFSQQAEGCGDFAKPEVDFILRYDPYRRTETAGDRAEGKVGFELLAYRLRQCLPLLRQQINLELAS